LVAIRPDLWPPTYLGPRSGTEFGRLLKTVGSTLALVCLVVVLVVVVSAVVVQPTSAITHVPRSSGISFFMNLI